MKRINPSQTRGFTLLEVLVSTVLLGSVFVAVLSLASQSLRNIGHIEPQERALVYGREKMNEILLLEKLGPGTQSGRWDDGYQWQVEILPSPMNAQLQNPTYVLFQIRVIISWAGQGNSKTYTVETTQWAPKVTQNGQS
jgi:general secretion pathway protein I